MHELGGFESEFAVVVGGAVTHLPRAVHFVAEAPIVDFPRLFATILFAQAGGGGVLTGVDVFDPLWASSHEPVPRLEQM